MMDLDKVKGYLRIDGNEEDDTLRVVFSAAVIFLQRAGVKEDFSDELYCLTVLLLVSHWFENRQLLGKSDQMPYALDSMIFQLKYKAGG